MKPVILSAQTDNYIYLLADHGHACVIDPAAAQPVIDYLENHDLTLELILNTHHHQDHCAGNSPLKSRYGCSVWGGGQAIAGLDRILVDAEKPTWCGNSFRVLTTPGHTRDSLCYYWPESQLLFTGDTLFIGGCGRLFEGSAEDLWQSFQKILALPDETLIYCGHDYALENCEFASHIQPGWPGAARCADLKELARKNRPLVPASLQAEKISNVFLRARTPAELGRLRELKNRF